MESDTQPDALLRAQEEIRDLRTTIEQMRAALERAHADRQQAAQHAASEAALEAAHLRETISAMREQLQTLQHEKQDAIQRAASKSFTDIQEFTVAIRALRDEMEKMREAHAVEVQDLRRGAREENRLLEETIVRLREQLEVQHGRG